MYNEPYPDPSFPSHFEAQKEYFERKYLHNFGMQVVVSPPAYIYMPDASHREAVAHPEVILSLHIFHPIKVCHVFISVTIL